MREMAFVAEALCYPAPGSLERLEIGWQNLPASAAKDDLGAFLNYIQQLTLGEWEELHTHTLDLNPPAAPYLGYQTWGESYQRGIFMAQLNREFVEAGVSSQGELPDHLVPVLRYLDSTVQPLPELLEILEPAVRKITTELKKSDPNNPYLHLLKAVLSAYDSALVS